MCKKVTPATIWKGNLNPKTPGKRMAQKIKIIIEKEYLLSGHGCLLVAGRKWPMDCPEKVLAFWDSERFNMGA